MSRTEQRAFFDIDSINLIDYVKKFTILKFKNNSYEGCCPFHKEKTPSFKIKNDLFTCFGCGKSGKGVIKYVMEYYNCDYKAAINILEKEEPSKTQIKKTIIRETENKEIDIEFSDMGYSEKHIEYFKNIEKDWKNLVKENIYAVREWGIGPKGYMQRMKIPKNEIVFAYWAEDIKKCKILRIGEHILPEMKWRTNVPNTYLWYYNDIPKDCDLGFVVKSVKDRYVINKLGYCAIATNNEGSKILLNNNIEKINNIFKNPIMCWGADNQGVKETKLVTEATGWGYFNTPKYLYDQYKIEDTADLLNNGFDYKTLDILIKQKLRKYNNFKNGT